MAFHVSGKLCAFGIVIAALITAFSVPRQDGIDIAFAPVAVVREIPRPLEDASTLAADARVGPVANPVFRFRATGYNSHAGQTDSTPDITATGARTRFGIIAVSRDVLGDELPYGSLVRIRDLGSYYNGRGAGRFQSLLDGQLFVVEDTMHPRKTDQVDVWFPDLGTAVQWGVRQVEVELVRYGRTGPEIVPTEIDEVAALFDATPRFDVARPSASAPPARPEPLAATR